MTHVSPCLVRPPVSMCVSEMSHRLLTKKNVSMCASKMSHRLLTKKKVKKKKLTCVHIEFVLLFLRVGASVRCVLVGLDGAEVLAPARPPRVFLQPLLLSTSEPAEFR